ncbi:MAG: hypothetical protein RIK87_23070 [Fuerstiella sp.]
MSMHLLFPLFSSVVFVLGMMLAKRAIDKGVSPWTGTFLGNLWLALIWAGIAVARGEIVPTAAWGQACIVGVLFVLGQLFTYLAFQFGDVSVATPVFGVKVLMVAALTSLVSGEQTSVRVWVAGAMATAGVVLIQWSGGSPAVGHSSFRRRSLTVVLALSAALSLSLFDVCLQTWGNDWDSFSFLPVMFGAAGVMSVVFLPWVNGPKRLRSLHAGRWILGGTVLMALQAMSMCFSLAQFGDAVRINIVYSLRGLWGVLLAWLLAKQLQSGEATLGAAIMLRRLTGAVLLTAAVLLSITA